MTLDASRLEVHLDGPFIVSGLEDQRLLEHDVNQRRAGGTIVRGGGLQGELEQRGARRDDRPVDPMILQVARGIGPPPRLVNLHR